MSIAESLELVGPRIFEPTLDPELLRIAVALYPPIDVPFLFPFMDVPYRIDVPRSLESLDRLMLPESLPEVSLPSLS